VFARSSFSININERITMEPIKPNDAFKKALSEFDRAIRDAQERFRACLAGGAAAMGVPEGWQINPKTLDFEPPLQK
jgi:hypothetical protein